MKHFGNFNFNKTKPSRYLNFEGVRVGVDALNPLLTINGTTVEPLFRYKGGDANSTEWPAWGYGEDLPIVNVATEPSYNDGSPLIGSNNDDSAKFNDSDYYQDTGTSAGNITTEDLVIEAIVKLNDNGTFHGIVAKHETSISGYMLYLADTGNITLRIRAGATQLDTLSATISDDAWYHVMAFADRSGSAQIYLNGVASGSPTVISTASGSLGSATSLTLANRSDGSMPADDTNIAYAAMWAQSSWLDTHLQAAERFAKLIGTWTKEVPSTNTRATVGTLVKNEGDGYYKIYTVGDNWLRTSEPPWASAPGFHSELAATNLCLQSEDVGTTWTAVNVTAGSTSVAAPDGTTGTTHTITEDGTAAAVHNFEQSITAGNVQVTFSVFAKAANRDFLITKNASVGTGGGFF